MTLRFPKRLECQKRNATQILQPHLAGFRAQRRPQAKRGWKVPCDLNGVDLRRSRVRGACAWDRVTPHAAPVTMRDEFAQRPYLALAFFNSTSARRTLSRRNQFASFLTMARHMGA